MIKIFKPKATRGFTLIELLVVLAIFIIITSIILARQNKFSSDILLTDLTYQIGISIRQAQVYGLGVRSANSSFDTGYGIHFENIPATTYKFFADTNKNGIGESGETSPGLTTYQLEKGGKIAFVCGAISSGGYSCTGSGGITSFNIIYIRPDPAALITSNLDQPQNPPVSTYSSLVITVQSALGDRYKCITAYQTGQVSVSNPPINNPPHLNPCI